MNKAKTAAVKMVLLRQFTGEIAMKAKTRKDRLLQRTRAAGLLLAVCSALAGSAALAANTVEFHVSGSIQPGTCHISMRADPDLGEYSADDFTGVGYATVWKYFDVVSNGCGADSAGHTYLSYSGVADTDNPVLYHVTGASGIGVEIESDNSRSAAPGEKLYWDKRVVGGAYAHKARLKQTLPEVTVTAPTATTAAITITTSYN